MLRKNPKLGEETWGKRASGSYRRSRVGPTHKHKQSVKKNIARHQQFQSIKPMGMDKPNVTWRLFKLSIHG